MDDTRIADGDAMTTTLTAPAIIRNVEHYLAQQYVARQARQPKREVETRPADGVVVILAWCVVVLLIWK